MLPGNRVWLLLVLTLIAVSSAQAQIDPVTRRLIEVGYNQPIQGHEPLAGYAFFYYNQPGFYDTNLTLRAAIAPVYIDSELGISHLLGPHTDLAFGLAGGGFGDSYPEFRKGVYELKESFWGDGVEASSSIYHLFNPDQRIPLNLVLRGSVRESLYRRDSGNTAPDFQLPDDRTTFQIRTGLRFGGQEPSLTEPLAMELSIWQESLFRMQSGTYGFNGDREVEPQSYLLWGRALLKYMLPESEQLFALTLTAGTTWDADRFSAYRLGGFLPFAAEFPLSIPGYFYQEISAERFALLNANYSLPLGPFRDWRFEIVGAAGPVDYLPGLEQPGRWHSGAGAGITYISPSGSWIANLLYGHGFNALRDGTRGADQVSFLFQYDFEAKARGKNRFFVPSTVYRTPGMDR
jgi:hypothetical protein